MTASRKNFLVCLILAVVGIAILALPGTLVRLDVVLPDAPTRLWPDTVKCSLALAAASFIFWLRGKNLAYRESLRRQAALNRRVAKANFNRWLANFRQQARDWELCNRARQILS